MRTFIISCNYNVKDLHNKLIINKKITNKDVIYALIDNNSKKYPVEKKYKELDFQINLDTNIGKAKALNFLVKELDKKYSIEDNDLIFSLDSDITLYTDSFFNTLEKCKILFEKNKVSCLVCSQTGNSLTRRDFEFTSYKNEFDYFIGEEGYGLAIAGGGIIIPFKNWKIINGYKEELGIYGGNDGNLFLDLWKITKLPICVIKQLLIFHPFENDINYKEWKDQQHQNIVSNGKSLDIGFYD